VQRGKHKWNVQYVIGKTGVGVWVTGVATVKLIDF